MVYEIPHNHFVCTTCKAVAPKSWVRAGHAIQAGTRFYCSQHCFENSPCHLDSRTMENLSDFTEEETLHTV